MALASVCKKWRSACFMTFLPKPWNSEAVIAHPYQLMHLVRSLQARTCSPGLIGGAVSSCFGTQRHCLLAIAPLYCSQVLWPLPAVLLISRCHNLAC